MSGQITPLTTRQKQLVILSFSRIIPISGRFSKIFYERLWEIAPETKYLFESTHMDKQREKLFKAISTAITCLDNFENLVPLIHKLGERHKSYGVNREHYHYMGQALLSTLAQELGYEFTPDVEEAWSLVYQLLADVATEVYDYAEESK